MSDVRYVGIDGGGTKTSAVLVDTSGAELARATGGSSNPSAIGLNEASQEIHDVVRQVAPVGTNVGKLWAGLSGFGRSTDHAVLRPMLETVTPNIKLTNDIELVLAALPESEGVACIAGTGSIAAGRNAEQTFKRSGGWGHLYGDEGSAFGIARDGLRAVARDIDQIDTGTSLTDAFLARAGAETPHDLIRFIYQPKMDKAKIAELAQIVFAEEHDPIAGQIIDRAADSLAELIVVTARKLEFTEVPPIAFAGGLLINVERIRKRTTHRVAESLGEFTPILVPDPALLAAQRLAEGY